MSNDAPLDLSTVEKMREFLKKAPPQSPDQTIFGSAVLAHLEIKDRELRALRKQVAQMSSALGLVVKRLRDEGWLASAAPQEETQESERQHDQTPFPAGVAPQGAPAAGAPKTGPLDDDEKDLRPNAQSGPPTNAAPIPNKVAQGPQPVPQRAQNNGSKAEAAK
jgi:hypothetical protein